MHKSLISIRHIQTITLDRELKILKLDNCVVKTIFVAIRMGPTKSDRKKNPSDSSKDCFDKLTTRKIVFAY